MKDFSIIKIISRGAFGQVFLGYKNTDESKLFAIKVSEHGPSLVIGCSYKNTELPQV